jgi:tetratricopeptide (TPR) repeat protein
MRGVFRTALAALLATAGVPAVAQHEGHGSALTNAAVQPRDAYARGLYLLHNFEYGLAAEAFRAAQKADPGNVMAFWGEAMTYNHPLWAEQDTTAARAALGRFGPDPAARRAKARSPKERQWLGAVEALYGTGSKIDRDRAYHAEMKAMFEADPADIDARTFYALSTLGLAHDGRDTALYMRAAALLEEVYPQHPDHPGVLHYLIHSYDDPAHAPLGERAAARYARVAPDAGHAQHMVSHIYLALGRWDEVERANRVADNVVDAQRRASGRPPTACGHYNQWLIYSLDQQGKDSASAVTACEAEARSEFAAGSDNTVLGAGRLLFNNWANIAVQHGVDIGRWPTWSTIPPGNSAALGRFALAYGRVLASRRNAPSAAAGLADMKRYFERITAAMPTERPDDHESAPWFARSIAQAEAVLALAQGRQDEGLRLLLAAAEAESALPLPFGPPVLAKPSWELLGDEYLALGRKAEAAAAYRQVLAVAPNRRLALIGLKQAEAR